MRCGAVAPARMLIEDVRSLKMQAHRRCASTPTERCAVEGSSRMPHDAPRRYGRSAQHIGGPAGIRTGALARDPMRRSRLIARLRSSRTIRGSTCTSPMHIRWLRIDRCVFVTLRHHAAGGSRLASTSRRNTTRGRVRCRRSGVVMHANDAHPSSIAPLSQCSFECA